MTAASGTHDTPRADNPLRDHPDYDLSRTPPLTDAELDELDALLQDLPADELHERRGARRLRPRWSPAPARWRSCARATGCRWSGAATARAPRRSPAARSASARSFSCCGTCTRSTRCSPTRPTTGWKNSVAETDDGELIDAEDWCVPASSPASASTPRPGRRASTPRTRPGAGAGGAARRRRRRAAAGRPRAPAGPAAARRAVARGRRGDSGRRLPA
ncbi:MAG: hypothetical protein MZW92_26175 [Comamonadaceae bacterium]|nr:hypothetical protein [Comamonadaceae bacterium]